MSVFKNLIAAVGLDVNNLWDILKYQGNESDFLCTKADCNSLFFKNLHVFVATNFF